MSEVRASVKIPYPGCGHEVELGWIRRSEVDEAGNLTFYGSQDSLVVYAEYRDPFEFIESPLCLHLQEFDEMRRSRGTPLEEV